MVSISAIGFRSTTPRNWRRNSKRRLPARFRELSAYARRVGRRVKQRREFSSSNEIQRSENFRRSNGCKAFYELRWKCPVLTTGKFSTLFDISQPFLKSSGNASSDS